MAKEQLTKRQLEVVNLIKLGRTNKQIAYVMQLNEQTIKHHVSVVLRKLDADDRAHAVYLCMKKGIID